MGNMNFFLSRLLSPPLWLSHPLPPSCCMVATPTLPTPAASPTPTLSPPQSRRPLLTRLLHLSPLMLPPQLMPRRLSLRRLSTLWTTWCPAPSSMSPRLWLPLPSPILASPTTDSSPTPDSLSLPPLLRPLLRNRASRHIAE